MKKKLFKNSSRLAFRSGLYSGIAIGLFTFVLDLFFFTESFLQALLFGGLMMILSAVVVYFIIHRMILSRLKTLDDITRNITNKHFESYENVTSGRNDELNYLIKQSIRASKTVEREIQRLNRIENYRKEFIGDISHELKTPIFAIQGFIETLLNGAIDDEQVNRRFLEKAMRNVSRLIYLTKDLMEISKLETGELKSQAEDIHLKKVMFDVVENLQYKAKDEEVLLNLKDFAQDYMVHADRNQIKQVLINLIENAIKYNKKGGSVKVGVKNFPKDKNRILVYVQDTGIGIEPQYVERITERFFRIDKSRSREKGGTGLGLAIVKHIMEAHGEEFFIESTVDEGSTFSFTLTKASGNFE
ncbi:MAG TPA: ATP-binding protein [Balneolaceae bacterium]|nr:ATP-binding protein [Balneolaceae bacterium]